MQDAPVFILIKFWDRTFVNKIARIVYLIVHSWYLSVFFYFVPFSTIFTSFIFIKMPDAD